MPYLSFAELIPIVGIIALFVIARSVFRRGGGKAGSHFGPALVLSKFKVDEFAPDGVFIEMEGRPSGLIAWLLALMGVTPTTTLRLTNTEFHRQAVAFHGQSHDVAPLSLVCHTSGGYAKPFAALVAGLLFAVVGLFGGVMQFIEHQFENGLLVIMFGLIIGGVLVLYYWFSKKFYIEVTTSGNTSIGAMFRQGVIEGAPVDIEKTLAAVGLLHRKVVESQMPGIPG